MPSDEPEPFRLPLHDRVDEGERRAALPLAPPKVTIPLAPPQPAEEASPDPQPGLEPTPDPLPTPAPERELRQFPTDELLKHVVGLGCSDLHLAAGHPPHVRLAGRLEPVEGHDVLGPDDVRRCLGHLLEAEHWQSIDRGETLDVVRPVAGLARFRVNAYPTSQGLAAVLHLIPWKVPALTTLGLPAVVTQIAQLPAGLVLVGGSTGSGRSTTLASLFDAARTSRAGHAMTIESSVEFVLTDGPGLVSQREVGPDAAARVAALREANRQDVDIVLVDDLDDLDVLTEALAAAASGRLVLGAVRSQTAAAAIERVILGSPKERRPWVRAELAASLRAVIAQVLCRRADGSGLVVATELLRMTPELVAIVRDGDLAHVPAAIGQGSELRMQTMDDALAGLVDRGEVTLEEAARHSPDPDVLNRRPGP